MVVSVWEKIRPPKIPISEVGKGTIKILPQTGEVKSFTRDRGRRAMLPGKRISKTGKTYFETRRNRSDRPGKLV